MSDKVTVISTDSGEYAEWGHLPYHEAIERFREHYEYQAEQAEQALKDLDDGKVRVFHQRNLHAVRDRREVTKE